ncbi:COG1361 S-layer family protein [Halospeciosus flavus]|uniref:COG1361 S-layer family protein n=1 Tax=Halospeciosus flavus TaxID=3032283 RepID=A0ABD5Z6F3_9EURY|nr:COG1361 S-layer family protein [Halospeciosus flavus]
MTKKKSIGAILLVALLVIPVVPAVADGTEQVIGSPSITLSSGDNYVQAGEEARVRVTVVNSGNIWKSGPSQFTEQVTEARNVQLTVLDEQLNAPVNVKSGTITLGSIASGSVQTAALTVEVGEQLKPGRYKVPVRVEYDYTSMVNYQSSQGGYSNIEFVDSSRTTTRYVEIVVEARPQFSIISSQTSNLLVGDTGQYEFTIKNTGEQVAHRASVEFSSSDRSIYFGSQTKAQQQARVFIPELKPGETYNGSIKVGSTDGSTAGSYPIEMQVNYTTPKGIAAESNLLTTGVTVEPERTFTLSNISSNLRVGEEGTVTATLTNQGPGTVSNAVAKLSTSADAVHPQRTEFALEQLSAGESTQISFPVEVSDSGEAGPHQFRFTVEYQNKAGETQQSDSIPATVAVAAERKQFTVKPVDVSLTAGSAGAVTVAVTNNGNEPLSNVNAKIFVDNPLSTSDDTAFAPTIAPGETVNMRFELSVAGSALAKPYPVTMDFQYETPDGDQQLSETYTVAANVSEPAGGGPSPILIGGVVILLVVLAGGIYWYLQN